MSATVHVDKLTKVFTSNVPQPGAWGAVKGLIKPVTKEVVAAKDVSFSIEEGEFIGFLGPNGAGKTTTIKMLTGILYPTSGEARVMGHEPFQRHPDFLRQIALVMGNRQQLWWDLPAMESFRVLADVYDIDQKVYRQRLDELVEALSLSEKLDVQVRKLSLGERMKCELVAALLHHPQVVFLDEPTLGLDIVSQRSIRNFLRDYNKNTKATILLTSHYMQDVEELCSRVVVINHGSVVYDGGLADLSRKFGNAKTLRLTLSEPVGEDALKPFGQIREHEGLSVSIEIDAAKAPATVAGMLEALPVVDLSLEDSDVESVIERVFAGESTAPTPAETPQ